jgi:hypothetical protein
VCVWCSGVWSVCGVGSAVVTELLQSLLSECVK